VYVSQWRFYIYSPSLTNIVKEISRLKLFDLVISNKNSYRCIGNYTICKCELSYFNHLTDDTRSLEENKDLHDKPGVTPLYD
jgi:hypothetical protein